MGLFSRKKKTPKVEAGPDPAAQAAQAAQAQAAQAQAAQAAQAAAQQRAAAAASAEKDAQRAKEERTLASITLKRRNIQQMEKAVIRFEEERKKAMLAASSAKKAKRNADAQSHLRNAQRLKTRIEQYQNRVLVEQQQLDAIEDASAFAQQHEGNKMFKQNIEELKVDVEDVEETLQDMREAMAGIEDINLAVKADAELNKGAYDMDDAFAELEEFEAELAESTTDAIPDVPNNVPSDPAISAPKASTAASSTQYSAEEEEIRRLEAGMAL